MSRFSFRFPRPTHTAGPRPWRWLAAPILAGLVFAGAGCGGASTAKVLANKPVVLNVWGVFDGEDTMRPMMTNYQKLHPNVSFAYRVLRSDEYKNELVRAFAEGRGPDIFSLHSSWIGEEQPLIAPLPKTLAIPFTETKGTIKKETTTVLKTRATTTLRQLRDQYLDTVGEDVVRPYKPTEESVPEARIWGLPLSVDSMALFYNRDLLNGANIAKPPATWTEFQEKAVPKLTSVGANYTVLQSGAAIGTSKNVERAVDLLSVLMMQNGTVMVDDRGAAAFGEQNAARENPGAQAVKFYTDFANPLTLAYTWNAKEPASFDAFANGQTAFFFGYSYHVGLLKARNPKLKFGIAPLPQIGNDHSVNVANYWVETVAKASANQTWAWDFVEFAASPEQVKTYLKIARKPPARKDLIADVLEDEELSVFANQLLTAKTWYRGKNAAAAEQALLNLIDQANAGAVIEDATAAAQNKVNQTL